MTFEGFPAGELEYISVPDLFFTQLVPQIDNLAELKVVLHLIWLRQRRGRQAVTWAELEADETLASSLACLGDPESILEEGLEQALTRKSVLHVLLQSPTETQDIYALNSESGRRALAAVKEGHIGIRDVVVMDRPSVEPAPNIFQLYEDNIGLISPILSDELRDAEATYPADWIEDAFRIAAVNNVRKWRYIVAILERWATQGKDDGTNWKSTETERRWYTDEEYEQFFEH